MSNAALDVHRLFLRLRNLASVENAPRKQNFQKELPVESILPQIDIEHKGEDFPVDMERCRRFLEEDFRIYGGLERSPGFTMRYVLRWSFYENKWYCKHAEHIQQE